VNFCTLTASNGSHVVLSQYWLSFLLLYDGTRTVFCIVLYHTAVMLYTAAAAADDDDDVSMSDVVTSCTDV